MRSFSILRFGITFVTIEDFIPTFVLMEFHRWSVIDVERSSKQILQAIYSFEMNKKQKNREDNRLLFYQYLRRYLIV